MIRHVITLTVLSRRAALLILPICLIAAALAAGCTGSSPAAPMSAAQTGPVANITISSIAIKPEASASGRVYRVVVTLRESGGAPATIGAIDLQFMDGSTMVMSSHVDRPISDDSNVCAANATIASREIAAADNNPAHPQPTRVVAQVTFTDATGAARTASASADVPPVASPQALTFTLSGLVSDEPGSRAVAGGTVRIEDGSNAGKSATTDSSGRYAIPGVAAGTLTVRATANDYESGQKTVTLSNADATADFRLRSTLPAPTPPPTPTPTPAPTPPPTPTPTPEPCSYVLSPTSMSATWRGGTFTVSITRISGSCSWQAAGGARWITVSGASSGNGNATLSYNIAVNGGVFASGTRLSALTVSWSGGGAQVAVEQGGANPELCVFTIDAGGQSQLTVPSAGGQFTANVKWIDTGIPANVCVGTLTGTVPWLSAPNSTVPATNGTVTFTVAPNPSPGSPRTGALSLKTNTNTATLNVTQQ